MLKFKKQCNICGKPANEIDHIKGNSNKINNLQLLCYSCHKEKTMQNIVPIKPGDEGYEEVFQKRMEIELRINYDKPLQLCDDEEKWKDQFRDIEVKNKKKFYKSVRLVAKNFKEKGYSPSNIAGELNKGKIPTYSGKKWDRKNVGLIFNAV